MTKKNWKKDLTILIQPDTFDMCTELWTPQCNFSVKIARMMRYWPLVLQYRSTLEYA